MVPKPVDHKPAMARSTDVLPTPLGPITSSDSPAFTCWEDIKERVSSPYACQRKKSALQLTCATASQVTLCQGGTDHRPLYWEESRGNILAEETAKPCYVQCI